MKKIFLLAALLSYQLLAHEGEHWVATWAAAPLETTVPAGAPASAAAKPTPIRLPVSVTSGSGPEPQSSASEEVRRALRYST